MTPNEYHSRPAPLEQLRCAAVRASIAVILAALALAARALPDGHPVRIYVLGRVPELRAVLIAATVPASLPQLASIAKRRRVWIAGLVLLACALIGDLSSAIAFDPFGLPDVDGSLTGALGIQDGLDGTSHVLALQLPWEEASRAGTVLLTGCICAVYALRPRHISALD